MEQEALTEEIIGCAYRVYNKIHRDQSRSEVEGACSGSSSSDDAAFGLGQLPESWNSAFDGSVYQEVDVFGAPTTISIANASFDDANVADNDFSTGTATGWAESGGTIGPMDPGASFYSSADAVDTNAALIGEDYRFETTGNVTNSTWQSATDIVSATQSPYVVNITATNKVAFYRLKLMSE